MEHLNKQQIILLALLVSFVSSIATGIVVVSITEQGSQPAITQTINRVVERTIERAVSPDSSGGESVKETVIVREDEAIVNAIAEASRSIVRVYYTYGGAQETFAGLGVIASSAGKVFAKVEAPAGASLVLRLSGGNSVSAVQTAYDPDKGLSTLQAAQSDDPLQAKVYSAARFADAAAVKLGQTVAVVGGRDSPEVAVGIVSSLADGRIRTSVGEPSFDTQSILVNLRGEVLGMKLGNAREDGYVTSF